MGIAHRYPGKQFELVEGPTVLGFSLEGLRGTIERLTLSYEFGDKLKNLTWKYRF